MSSNGDLPRFIEDAIRRCSDFPQLRSHEDCLRAALSSYDEAFSVAVVGRIKMGKSTLMNALVGAPLAPVGVTETTATINRFQYGTGSPCIHWQGGKSESVSAERLSAWVGSSPEVLERIKQTAWIDFFVDMPRAADMRIIDTPGIGSVVQEHEEVVRKFLDTAAAIVYVLEYPGKEEDLKTLTDFNGTRDDTQANSVCVLHKWDYLECEDVCEEAWRQAGRVKEQLGNVVAEVIPVSGPVALVARNAPDNVLNGLADWLKSHSEDELKAASRNEDRWIRDPARLALLKAYPYWNWNSFKLILRELRKVSQADVTEIRQHLENFSRVPELEEVMKERFFERSVIIKQSQLARRIEPEFDAIILRLRQLVEETKNGIAATEEAMIAPGLSDATVRWLKREHRRLKEALAGEDEAWSFFDGGWSFHEGEALAARMDLETVTFIDSFPADLAQDKPLLLAALQGGRRQELQNLPVIYGLIDKYRGRSNRASRKEQPIFEHIVDRLRQHAAQLN